MSTTSTSVAPGRESVSRPGGTAQRRPRKVARTVVRILPLAPAVVLLLLFMAGPVLWSLYGSFTNAALTGPNAKDPQWIGADNYVRLLQDPDFPRSVVLTVVFVLFSAVIGQNVLGMALALLMTRASGGVSALIGGVVVAAWVLPEIVAAFVMYAFFTGEGTLNQLLGLVGVDGPNWLFVAPMFAVILANIWRGTAFSMMVYRAALDDVPPEIVEAAQIDGAGPAQRLFRITLPVIKGTIATNLMLITLQTLSVFTLIFVMTAGGPSNRSMTLPLLAYEEAFNFLDVGYGTAIATVMLLVGVLFSVVYIRMLRPGRD
ncbi:carbohydrate ABC transporter permease [Georgenia subflava]|uniref:ABC transporter permease subunit n=1 Tax=Georgenia subflava TaxID=1622177 RepID=A0A6N7EBT1_9MICO|nr:sugar ABC transporter permease [Georgenia subflava]MPV35579.1 ABC transporter permease subunit [Georgenia subflava]